jgi:porin
LKHRSSFRAALLPGLALLPALSLGSEPGRTESSASGIRFDAAYTGEPIRNTSGGIRTGGTYLDNLDLQISADRGSIFGIAGLSGLLYAQYNSTNDFSEKYLGDAQLASNIDSASGWRLYEAWLDWATGESGSFSTRLGLYDLNTEFDATETGSLFLNGAHGMGTDFGQTGENGPSVYPVTSLALRLKMTGANGAYGQLAILDGIPGDPDDPSSNKIDLSSDDGALLVLEGGFRSGAWRKLAVGLWRYTADFDQLATTEPSGNPQRGDGNDGWYVIADRTLWTDKGSVLAGFLRFGQADDTFNTFDGYLGLGASLTGFWSARPDDAVGLGLAKAFTGNDYQDAQELAGSGADSGETSIELTYRTPITDWLTLQPDLQYVINPGVDPALDNALVILLRFELSFSRRLTGG